MYSLSVIQVGKCKLFKKKKSLIEKSIPIFFRLLDKSLKNRVSSIEVELISGLKKNCGISADVDFDEAGEYVIRIEASLTTDEMLNCLAHEIVHIKQFMNSELIRNGVNSEIYHGVIYDLKKVNYWDLPSEIEAYGRAEGMVVRFYKKARV